MTSEYTEGKEYKIEEKYIYNISECSYDVTFILWLNNRIGLNFFDILKFNDTLKFKYRGEDYSVLITKFTLAQEEDLNNWRNYRKEKKRNICIEEKINNIDVQIGYIFDYFRSTGLVKVYGIKVV